MQLNGGECRYHTLHQNIDARSQTVQIYIYIYYLENATDISSAPV